MTNPVPDAADVQSRVLSFYRGLAFNRHASVDQQIEDIKAFDPVTAYEPLQSLLGRKVRVLEVGSGTGWMSNSMSRHYGAQVTGIDLNPDAVAFSREVAQRLRLSTQFECADLFRYQPTARFPVVVSLGVLHHTHDCIGAVQRVCRDLLAPGGHAFIGLYHLHGRRPFLEHFRQMQQQGASEQQMLARYRELHTQLSDDTHALSWFRDQVLHPHETQHTLQEMVGPLAAVGCDVVATSINGFRPLTQGLEAVYPLEAAMEQTSLQRLKENRYYPGFFLFLVRKRTD